MVRSDALPIIADTLNYEFFKKSTSIGVISSFTELDHKTIKKALSGKPVSEKVIRKLANFFNVPPSFFCDFISDDQLELFRINSWQGFVKETKQDDDFQPFIDIDMDKPDSKSQIDIIEKFIETLTHYINTFKSSQNKHYLSSELIDVSEKTKEVEALKTGLKLSQYGREIEKFANFYYGRYLWWEENTTSIDHYGYITYNVYSKLVIEISNNSLPRYYNAPIGKIPNNPSKVFTKNEISADFMVHYNNYNISRDKLYTKQDFLDWKKKK